MKIDDYLSDVKSVAITGHIRPDGDCVGSTLSLYNYIKKNYPDIDTHIFIEQPTNKLAFLKGFDEINSSYESDIQFDLMFCLDSASLERIGKSVKFFEHAGKTVNIDHHISNPQYADENYVFPESSSTCEVLYGFLMPEKIDRDIAIALYTGIIYDTGVFKYPSTSPATMRIAADLMEYDIPTNYIIDESFYAKTYDENRIFGYAVLNSRLAFNGRVIYSYVTRKTIKEFGVSSKELEGIVSQLRLTKDVWCAVWLHEIEDDKYKISFRSGEEVDVNELAVRFGGGGHKRAAGADISGPLDECIERILKEIGTIIG